MPKTVEPVVDKRRLVKVRFRDDELSKRYPGEYFVTDVYDSQCTLERNDGTCTTVHVPLGFLAIVDIPLINSTGRWDA